VIEVANHGGNKRLGGTLLDWKIVEEVLAPAVA
jgi:molecular chaperone DnaK (HSP70)